MTLFETIRRSAVRRASYFRTARELRAMPLDLALDIDIDRKDAGKIARQAVYGA